MYLNLSTVTQRKLQIFISFFFKTPKKRKVVTVSAGTIHGWGHAQTATGSAQLVDTKIVLEDGDYDIENEDAAVLEEAETSATPVVDDDGCDAHDEAVSKTLASQAVQMMEDQGVFIGALEKKEALQLFPQVCKYDSLLIIIN